MAGLFDFLNSPAGMGLLSAVATGAAGARQGTPWNNVGRGAMGGLAGYAQANDQIRADEENAFQKQFRQTQMEQMQRQLETQRKQEQWRAGLPGVMAPKVSDQGAMLNEQNAAFGDEGTQETMDAGQYAPNAQLRMTPQVDQQAVQDYMLQPESPYADKLMERQLFPSAADYKTVGKTLLRVGANGQVEPVYTDAASENKSTIGQLIEERDKFQPGHPARAIYDEAIKKQTTHAPAAQLNNFGEPKPYWNEKTQRYEFYQFDKQGNPRVSTLPEGATPVDQGKLAEGPTKQITGVNNLQAAIDEYVNQLKTWNKSDALNPNKRAEMGVMYNNMMLQAKEAYNLGVLNGPDLDILTSVVTDPRSFTGSITSNDALAGQATQLSRIMENVKKQAATKPRPITPADGKVKRYNPATGRIE